VSVRPAGVSHWVCGYARGSLWGEFSGSRRIICHGDLSLGSEGCRPSGDFPEHLKLSLSMCRLGGSRTECLYEK
jgi:hypothetical protein